MTTTATPPIAGVEPRHRAAPPASPRRRRRSDLGVALIYIAPPVIGLVAFYIVPTIRGLYLSFTEYSVLGDPEWVGTSNYEALARDPLFWNAMVVTVEYVVINILLQTTIAVGLALLMHHVARSTLLR